MHILHELDLTGIYLLYKLGCALSALTLVSALICSVFFVISLLFIFDYKLPPRPIVIGFFTSLIIAGLFGGAVSFLPDKEELKYAAAYTITRKTVDSDTAQRTMKTVLDLIETHIKTKD